MAGLAPARDDAGPPIAKSAIVLERGNQQVDVVGVGERPFLVGVEILGEELLDDLERIAVRIVVAAI